MKIARHRFSNVMPKASWLTSDLAWVNQGYALDINVDANHTRVMPTSPNIPIAEMWELKYKGFVFVEEDGNETISDIEE